MLRRFPWIRSAILLLGSVAAALADDVIVGVPQILGNTATVLPFMIQQARIHSMRYQQVYAASAFAALVPTNFYVTRVFFHQDENADGAFCQSSNLEIRLSTTSKGPDALSAQFAENIGLDEMVVFATNNWFVIPNIGGALHLTFPKPFVYRPANGNLLLEVRVATAGDPSPDQLALDAHNGPGDAISRAYAPSADATQATTMDTVGLGTAFQFSPLPSLQIRVESVYGTNRPVVRWPAQPSVFVLQASPQFGRPAVWQTITSGIGGTPEGPDRWVYLAVQPPGASMFYRLVWPSNVGLSAKP